MASVAGEAVVNGQALLAGDQFSGRVSKLCALLELTEGGTAVAIGRRWSEWAPDLGSHFRVVSLADSADAVVMPGEPLQLILLDSQAVPSGSAARDFLASMVSRLAPEGCVVMFTSNRFSLRRIARAPASLFKRGLGSRGARRRALVRAGAREIEEFLPLPELWDAEEIVRDSSTIALPSHASRIDRAVLAMGLFPWLHDGFIHLASHSTGGTRRLRERLAAHLGTDAGSIVIERFDLRSRGALVLMARRRGSGVRVVCRIASSISANARIRRNAESIARVRGWTGMPVSVSELLPTSHGTTALPSGTCYVESLIEGVVAWKLAVPGAAELRLLEGTHDFARELGKATLRRARLDDPRGGELLDATVAGDPPTQHRLDALQERLRSRAAGKLLPIVMSHGDYGYGNVMARRDGTLTGVIDWDQARDDLAGVDLLNFLVQRANGMKAQSAAFSFRELFETICQGGFEAARSPDTYHVAIPGAFDDFPLVMAWTALRYVQRSAGYPALFKDFREEAHAILDWALEILT